MKGKTQMTAIIGSPGNEMPPENDQPPTHESAEPFATDRLLACSYKIDKDEEVKKALTTFVDFIYAAVFALLVQKVFEGYMHSADFGSFEKLLRLAVLLLLFYFLTWDWILARVLLIKNPFSSYTLFFAEVCIAALGYGVIVALHGGSLVFIFYFGLLLIAGGVWGWRMAGKHDAKEAPPNRDRRELCTIQHLHFGGGLGMVLASIWTYLRFGGGFTWRLALYFFIFTWLFVLAYEVMVPRIGGPQAGPGALLVNRSAVRRLRRTLRRVFRS